MHNERFEELAALEALGVPLGEDAGEFARHLAECDTCRVVVEEGREAATLLAGAVPPVLPRPDVKRKILAAIASDASNVSPSPVRLADRPASSGRLVPWLFAAAAALLFVFVVWDDARLRRERSDLRSQTAYLATRLTSAERDLARRELQARVLDSDDVRILQLGGKEPQPAARAKVFWSARAKRGVLVAGNLQPLPAGKQYELWVFSNGKPVPAGVFDADLQGRALVESPELPSVDAAQNFAVTVEPTGGVPAPTGPIVLVGAP
jgi:anti-sigma-K factor RskA